MRKTCTACVVGLVALAAAAQAQTPPTGSPPRPTVSTLQAGPARRDPMPDGQRIQANDGDVVVLDDDARIRVVRRRSGVVRLIYSAEQHWVLLLADFDKAGTAGDGKVDWHYQYMDVAADAPLPARWEGQTSIEEETNVGDGGGPPRLSLSLPGGRVQFAPGPPARGSGEAGRVVNFRGSGSGGERGTFDEVEQQQVQVVAQNVVNRRTGAPMISRAGGVTGSMAMTGGLVSDPSPRPPSPQAPVRVGGAIAPPEKIRDVKPGLTGTAARAGIRGTVIVEFTVGEDGKVYDVKVLRSIPLLDDEAVRAVSQWRYVPTHLNGKPVPVIMTAQVSFE
jgi:TonB family protein